MNVVAEAPQATQFLAIGLLFKIESAGTGKSFILSPIFGKKYGGLALLISQP